jgi:subtilisin family serine protease
MKIFSKFSLGLMVAMASSFGTVQLVQAESADTTVQAKGGKKGPPGGSGDDGTAAGGTYFSWMNSDIESAWTDGYLGQGTTITVVDDFRSNWGYYGDLGEGTELLRHGEWTYKQASMIAPGATMRSKDFSRGSRVKLASGFNVLNLSYGMYANSAYSLDQLLWSAQESSIISYAENGAAVISKAAGNDGIDIGGTNSDGNEDFLATALVGAQSAIFVGALDWNGTTDNQASLAWYSNTAGSNTTVQDQFLVVGVDGGMTGLYGTSFAAPTVSGYAAIVASKFTSASATQVASQLLTTAREDTILDYNAAQHGQGEACISCALAPVSVN